MRSSLYSLYILIAFSDNVRYICTYIYNSLWQLTTDEDHLNPVPISSTPVDNKPAIPPDESLPSDMLISLPGRVRLESSIRSIQTSIVTPDSEILPVADEETAEREREICVCVIFFLFYIEARRARIDSSSADDREFEDEGTK